MAMTPWRMPRRAVEGRGLPIYAGRGCIMLVSWLVWGWNRVYQVIMVKVMRRRSNARLGELVTLSVTPMVKRS